MSGWSSRWEGRATDFAPELLTTAGRMGPLGAAAKDAAWEAIQRAGEADPTAWVVVAIEGWDDKEHPGQGHITVSMYVKSNPSEIEDHIRRQQPVDLLRGRDPEPAAKQGE